ncbi:MAG: hypothetical protein U1A27_03755 [Phycisphaerae bacterium]
MSSARDVAVDRSFAAPPGPPAWLIAGVALLLMAGAFANALTCGFVYDDNRQIVDNYLIQRPEYFWTAMTSDVWGFAGERAGSVSNYFRPAAVLWMMVNYRLFGLAPLGWHVTNLLLHVWATLLVLRVVRQLGVQPAVAAAVTWLFAVHPVHVESVTWVAGSHDLLMAVGILHSFSAYLRYRASGRGAALVAAALWYLPAMFSKESAAAYVGVVVVCEWLLPTAATLTRGARLRRVAIAAAPLVGVVMLYLAARLAVHITYRQSVSGMSKREFVLFVPQSLVFYVRQVFAPFWLNPIHALRATPGEFDPWLWLPILISVALAVVALLLFRRDTVHIVGYAFFLGLLVLPIYNGRALPPEGRIHDRYLYLPLFGVLLVVVSRLAERMSPATAGRRVTLAGLVAALACCVLTVRYNPAFKNDLSLWEWTVRHDPNCVTGRATLSFTYRHAGRMAEARRQIDAALALEPDHLVSHLELAQLAADAHEWQKAEQLARRVLEQEPIPAAADLLGAMLMRQSRPGEAATLFESSMKQMPKLRVKYGINAAVAARAAGDVLRAIADLEAAQGAADADPDRNLLKLHAMLADLSAEVGRNDVALRAAEHFLNVSEGTTDPDLLAWRDRTVALLRRLTAGRRS